MPKATAPVRFLRIPAVVERIGICRALIYRKIQHGQFPKPVRIGVRAVGWIETEIDQWIADRIADRAPAPAQTSAPAGTRG